MVLIYYIDIRHLVKDRNIFYIGEFEPRHDLVEAPNRNIMQAGIRTSAAEEIQHLRREIQELRRHKTEALAQLGANYINQQTVMESNLKQAGIASTKSDKEVLDTMINFMNGDLNGGYQPPARHLVR